MTETDEILKAAGWDQWTDDDLHHQPWIFHADDAPEPAFDMVRFLVVRNGKALAVEVGFQAGPTLLIRAFDGTQRAVVGASSFGGAFLNVTVEEPIKYDRWEEI